MSRAFPRLALAACVLILTFLWLPGLRYPVVSDTAIYAELGESLWTRGTYMYEGVPFDKHLPFHPFLSYPLVAIAGPHLGMKLATLMAGIAVLLVSYGLLRRAFGKTIALGSVAVLTFHHAFVFMTMLGSADLLFAALFLGALLAYLRAGDDRRFYLVAGLLAGLSCVTRYNGIPLLPLLLFFTFWRRRKDLADARFWIGMALAVLPVSLWFLRNFLVFGNPLHSGYTAELGTNSRGPLLQMSSNLLFYLNPLHNVLPVLFVTAIYGLFRHGRRQVFLVFGMLSAWILTAIWWVQAMRFAFPGYPILIGFGIVGLFDIANKFNVSFSALTRPSTPLRAASRGLGSPSPVNGRGFASALAVLGIAAIVIMHLSFLCFYAYGACNAAVDRWGFPGLPRNLGLTSEGFYAWAQARDRLDAIAPVGSAVVVDSALLERAWKTDVFRSDIRVLEEWKCPQSDAAVTPVYHIAQDPGPTEKILFQTEEAPVTYLTVVSCK